MNKSETAKLLALISAFDRRTIGEADVEAWHTVLSDVSYDDAALAVKAHYRSNRQWLMPADVVTGIDTLRRWRLRNTPRPSPPPDLVDGNGYPYPTDREKWQAWQEWNRQITEAIANGEYKPDDEREAVAAIAAGPPPEPQSTGWWDN